MLTWEPDYQAEFERRIRARNKLLDDRKLQGMMMCHYRHNCIDWINDWCVTFDPRNVAPVPRLLPFNLFQRQEDFVHFVLGCLQDKESGLVEKCRDVGATWLCCAISVWLWLFHDGSVIGWGSLKEENIDARGNPKAIFPKIRQIIQYLPTWMLPVGFDPRMNMPYMKIINPANNSSIIGEAGDNIGRGGRTTAYFKDESAHYEHPELIEAALGDNTDVQIDISSVNGSANVFYRRRMAGEVWSPGCKIARGMTRVFIFDWRDHPKKTQEWHDLREAKAEREGLLHIFRQEVDRDYAGSIDRVIIRQEWVQAAINAHIKLNWPREGIPIAGQDVADDGGDKNALAIQHGRVITYCEAWGGEADAAAQYAIPIALENGCREMFYDCIGVGVGFRTECKHMVQENTLPKTLRVQPWDASAEPLDKDLPAIPGDKDSPLNGDIYKNLKAQSWFRTRARFLKTYKAVTKGEKYPLEEMISISGDIPQVHQIAMELSQAQRKTDTQGRTMVDKKPEGARSPNMADAIIIADNPARQPMGFFDDIV